MKPKKGSTALQQELKGKLSINIAKKPQQSVPSLPKAIATIPEEILKLQMNFESAETISIQLKEIARKPVPQSKKFWNIYW